MIMRPEQLESMVRLVTICEEITDTEMLPTKFRRILRTAADDLCNHFGLIGIGKTSDAAPATAPESEPDPAQTAAASVMSEDKPAVWDETNQRFIDREEWVAS
jgi:hypothetical protein